MTLQTSSLSLLQEISNDHAISKAIQNSVKFLSGKIHILSQFASIEDFAFAFSESEDSDLKACEYHLRNLRNLVSRILWRNQVFIGHSILEDLIFQLVVSQNPDPIRQLSRFLRNQGFQEDGVVIYPLHSFGILGFGFLQVFAKLRSSLLFPDFGIAITPQTNDSNSTFSFLEKAFKAFGLKRRVPKALIHHFIKSRELDWFQLNPLLLLRVRSWPGNYYENQFLLKRKLQFATTFVFMLATLRPPQGTSEEVDLSTVSINNRQTLDAHHYIVLHPKYRDKLEMNGQCVPMNFTRPELTEISDLNVVIDPRVLSRRATSAKKLFALFQEMENGYFKSCLRRKPKASVEQKIFLKLFQSLRYFRKSFRETESNFDEMVNVTIAFETMLIDSHPRGRLVSEISGRLKLALRGTKGSRSMRAAFDNLYKARCEIVHAGNTEIPIDIELCRKAFVLAFMNIMKRMHPLPLHLHEPMLEILKRR